MSKIDYQALRERYSPKPVPECSVCGEEMSIQRISGAHVVYACSSYGGDGDFKIGRTLADEHYEKSRVTVVDDSAPDVIALLDELEAEKSKLNEQREYYEGVISDGSKRIAELEAKLVSQTYKLHELSGNSPVTPDGWVMVPKKLTAENGAKGVLSGEFSETTFISCPECFGDDDCDTCDGSGRIEIKVPVTWATIKSIWDKSIEYFAAKPSQEVK
ncbi:ead/Ea22-like family protein [Escherichia coli]|nr:ead/Ea22-like family protein [Escherichia coli]MED9028203.1 ead/Ea22-like family protein [Escherichia coli]MED9074513.1 ead/Ea22-like family protein [Escherichia coli]MED9322178.1 ead/Ea22-like family protein [Escherichia coli]